MANIQRISRIEPTLAFTEFDMIEKYRKSFECSELGRVHASFPFESLAKKMGLKESPLGRTGHFLQYAYKREAENSFSGTICPFMIERDKNTENGMCEGT